MVFNLEVDAEHVYSVSSEGLSCHNSCPIDEFDVRPYGDFADHKGDALDGHELLQSGWLEHNLGITRGTAAGKLNPAVALTKEGYHDAISAMQRRAGLRKKQFLKQSARENVLENIHFLKAARVPDDVILTLLQATRKYMDDIGL